ncbi:general transcription factor IIIC subunit l(2)37Cd [Cotesia typhae]|uniref:general transcription factor IIIC subunit l(2)37Cd n=1 Tax=Cotesia typhae TaxID=2053667 RepID=UPI003D692CD0
MLIKKEPVASSYNQFFFSDDSNDEESNVNNANGNNASNNEEEEEEVIGPVLPGGHRLDEKFYCIKYPGKVINSEKAIESLGGLGSISTTINTPNRRLELKLRVSDVYCKPACGDRHEVSGFLLRIRVKKSRIKKVTELAKQKEVENYRNLTPAMPRDLSKQNSIDNFDREEIKRLSKELRNCEIYAQQNRSKTAGGNEKNQSLIDELSGDSSKNIPLKFSCNKMEDLSNETDYKLPKLKILGRVVMEFKFTSLIDFQYTPVTQSVTDPKRRECIYDSICPKGILTPEWLTKKVPYFLPPAVFSRMDTIQQYNMKLDVKEPESENVIGKNRKSRAGLTYNVPFTTETIPSVPKPGIEKSMAAKLLTNEDHQVMLKLFEKRPIWSRTALLVKTKFHKDQIRVLLPSVAYYFTTGPWRLMWVRLGYDPRKDPAARIYQILDYRCKAMHGLEKYVKGKRSYTNSLIPYKSAPAAKASKASASASLAEIKRRTKTNLYDENDYIYRRGNIPSSRQTLYQFCDVLTDEIQEMFAKLPDPMPGVKCDEKRGWLPPGFSEHCREIINKQVLVMLRKKMNIPINYPTTLPHKRKPQSKLMKAKNAMKRKLLEKKKKELSKTE